jgi:hypothetical protein
MAWTEQDYQEIVARLMASSIGVNEVPNADKADDVTSLPAFKPSGSNSEASVVNYPLEFLKGEQGEPGIQGEPGKSFKVAGEYATLEALKSAVPDGSAVDGFMAVGTEAPYDYYAWVNGEWVSQGKIGNIEEAPTDGKAYGRKNGNWAEVPEKSDVLTKTNSESFTPTSDYQPATKKYADNINYGKVINVSVGTYLVTNKHERDREAVDLIYAIFGTLKNLKEIILDIIENHTKYYFHSYNSKDNCIELSSVYSFYNPKTEEYNLQCNISYYTNNGPVSKRMGFKLMPNEEDCVASIEDILISDNLTTVTKKTAAKYDAIGSKDEGTMYVITDA